MTMLEKVEIAIRDSFNSNDIDCGPIALAAINALRDPSKDVLEQMAYVSGRGFRTMWHTALNQIIDPS